MNWSMEEYVRLAAPHLHPELVSPGELARITEIARLLPPVSSMFECRLGTEMAQADFLLRFTPLDGSRRLLLDHLEPMARAGDRRHQPFWRALHGFCLAWMEPGSLLDREVEAIWLELDLFGAGGRLPAPCFFFDFADAAVARAEATEEILALLCPGPLPEPTRRAVARCLEALPPGGRLFSVGTMFNRGADAIRLCLSHVPAHGVVDYLGAVGWEGPRGELDALLAGLADDVDHVALAVDVGERVSSTVGVEFHIEGETARRKVRWGRFLDGLVAGGHCVPAKRDAVLAWLGHLHARSAPEAWPGNLRALSAALGPDVLSTFLRQLSHVKVVYAPGRPLEAKAYLEFMHTWLRFDPGKRAYVFSEALDHAAP